MKTENTEYCTLCSTFINKENCKKFTFRKGKKLVVVCKWCIEKIKQQ